MLDLQTKITYNGLSWNLKIKNGKDILHEYSGTKLDAVVASLTIWLESED